MKKTLKDFVIEIIRDESITCKTYKGKELKPEYLEVAVWNPDRWDFDWFFSFCSACDILQSIDEEYLDYIVNNTDIYNEEISETTFRIEIVKSEDVNDSFHMHVEQIDENLWECHGHVIEKMYVNKEDYLVQISMDDYWFHSFDDAVTFCRNTGF